MKGSGQGARSMYNVWNNNNGTRSNGNEVRVIGVPEVRVRHSERH